MSWPAALAFALAVAAAGSAEAEKLTVALSTPEVTINSNFTGTAVTVFGVIDRDARSVSGIGTYEIAVLLLGPRETVVARRNDRILGIWANAASQTLEAAPAFYSLSTSVKVENLATAPVLERLQLGFDSIAFRYQGLPLTNDPAAGSFREAFIRLKDKAGLYHEQVGVNFIGNLIFRTTFYLPANIPVGAYTAEAYLFSDRLLIARADDKLRVSKTGLEDTMTTFARDQSLLYGLICVALALTIGWLGGVIFRRD
jgi:uncharacterized protein (TIGR02186 family)